MIACLVTQSFGAALDSAARRARRPSGAAGLALLCVGLLAGCPAGPQQAAPAGGNASLVDAAPSPGGDPPATGPAAEASSASGAVSLSLEEIAYLSLLFSRAGVDFDLTNIPADTDGDAIPNSVDDDVDGDGILNTADADIDGDGAPNAEDDDIDGDGLENDDDEDIDADAVENDEDEDADSDGLDDRFDLNDDGDDEADDEDEDDAGDDEDSEPKTGLEGLSDRLKRGLLSDNDKDRIVQEILDRLDSQDLKTELQAALVQVVASATDPNRLARPLTVPAGVNAIDQLYEQLDDAIREAKRGQFNPDGPFQNRARERRAAVDMVNRAKAYASLSRAFPTMLMDDVNESVKSLRTALEGERLTSFARDIRDHISPTAIGGIGSEKRELDALTKGGRIIGAAFDDADSDSLFDGIERLRARAATADPAVESVDEKYDRLLSRLGEIKSQSSSISLDRALTQVETEDGTP